jgi:hypothetical protein
MRPGLRLRRLLASALLVVYATVAVAGAMLVRCHELDGAVRLEWRGAGCCETTSPAGDDDCAASASAPGESDDCGGCTDQNFSDSMSATKSRDSKSERVQAPDVPTLPAPAVAATATFSLPPTVRPTGPMRAPHPPPALAAIRSVVLRS